MRVDIGTDRPFDGMWTTKAVKIHPPELGGIREGRATFRMIFQVLDGVAGVNRGIFELEGGVYTPPIPRFLTRIV
jgi:hypothetical protein